jgi:very-short-patch-repair endonuclease
VSILQHRQPEGRASDHPGSRLWLDGADSAAVARLVLSTPQGSFRTIVGLTPQALRSLLDEAPRAEGERVALIVTLQRFASAEGVIEDLIAALADTAARMWPSWHGARDEDLRGARAPSHWSAAISPHWVRLAEQRARRGAKPSPPGFAREVELVQFGLAINPGGLSLVVAPAKTPEPREASPLIHALEWVAHHADFPVVLALAEAPARDPAFERALSSAMFVAPPRGALVAAPPEPAMAALLAPVRGEPHPLSEVERRVARALRADSELAPLFGFNRVVLTIRGSTPRVDLLWEHGRLVVEFDGYADHGGREAFARDRHRDYELTLSGYTVLRVANDEVLEDLERTVEKIRDVVRSRKPAIREPVR